jgi:hypothetical protein
MEAVLLSSTDGQSPRWKRLCKQLGLVTTEDKYQALGHLWVWYQRWGSQPELDSGIWFRANLREIGSWAEVTPDQEVKWGRALLAAGYMEAIKDVYPEPLASLRKGYVALNAEGGAMLDDSFSQLKHRPNARTLCLYLMNRKVRNKWSRLLRVDCSVLDGAHHDKRIPSLCSCHCYLTPPSRTANVGCGSRPKSPSPAASTP